MRQDRNPGRAFASDNWAGVHPEVLTAMAAANVGHVPSYGNDPYTREAEERIRGGGGEGPEGFLVLRGAGANFTLLHSLVESPPGRLRRQTAPGHTAGGRGGRKPNGPKTPPVPSPNGKISV